MFNSRNSIYRNPIGAVKNGTSVHFKITLSREYQCPAAHLLIEREGHESHVLDMFWCGMNGDDKEWWECDFTPEEPGLYFYYFEFKTSHGRKRLSRGSGGQAIPQGFDRWQLTVYSKEYTVPAWLKGGIIYQIFPDRYFNSPNYKPELPDKYSYRSFHETWNEQPEWRPNSQGKIDNSDFFGGNLKGIEEKLPYISSLGVTCIYLNPIFEAFSNHRYDTADYSKIDPLLGTPEDFTSLCSKAREYGIAVVIDGVFNHTGSDSIYFNKAGRYDETGAYNSKNSKYYSWYNFTNWPEDYESWWGFDTLPNLNESDPGLIEYICGKDGIVRRWLRAGASGWRLDVADELPDVFLDEINQAAKDEKPDSIIIGEVWEDASTKTAYGVRRRYLQGGQLDSVMNYPFRDAIFSYLLYGNHEFFFEQVESIMENYPPEVINSLMNHIGTHDTERAITILAGEPAGGNGRKWQSEHSLSESQRTSGLYKMRLASLLQYTLPGVPSIYYGDEIGMEGYKDPFNRGTFIWSETDNSLAKWYKRLGKFRQDHPILSDAGFRARMSSSGIIAYERYRLEENTEEVLLIIANRENSFEQVPGSLIPPEASCVLGTDVRSKQLKLEPFSFAIYSYKKIKPTPIEKGIEPVPENDDIKIAYI